MLGELETGLTPDALLPPDRDEILKILSSGKEALLSREIRLDDRLFCETVHTVPEFGVVRIHVVEITGRTQMGQTPCRDHLELEQRIREKTEELGAANLALERERQRLYNLLDELPVIVCVLAPDFTYRFVNRRFREVFGDARGHPCFQAKAGRDGPCDDCRVTRVFMEEVPIEWQWTSTAGRVYQLYHYPVKDSDGSAIVLEVGIDITERTKIVEELRRSEEKYRMLVEGMGEGLGVTDANQVLTYVNKRICEMLGYSRDELLGRPTTDFVDADYRALLETQRQLRSKGERLPYEVVWIRKDGSRVTTVVTPRLISGADGRFEGSFGIVSDITERKRIEQALRESERRLHDLSAQLLQVQETERSRISRELHDELGQGLNTLKLRLAVIRNKLEKDQDFLRNECDETLAYVDQVIEDVRRLARDLSPRVLEDLGLVAALRHLINGFSRRSETSVSLKIDDIDRILSRNAEVMLYRIVQEILTNIGKHAAAERASVRIERYDAGVRCLIEDNGNGYDSERDEAAGSGGRGMGIAIMKERLRMLGGSIELWSRPGRGTRISVYVPAYGQGAR